MKEQDYYRALGVEPRNVERSDVGADKQQEVVEPAAQPENVTDPLDENTEEVVTPPMEAEEPEVSPQGEKPPMSKEERAMQAKLRRQREMDDAVAKARQEEQNKHKQEMDRLVKRMNLRDTSDSNKPIETVEQLEAWEAKRKEEKLERDLKAGRLTREALETVIEQSPTMQAARQVQQQQQPTQQAQASAVIEAEIEQIKKLDPSIKSLQDICDGPNGQQFRELVNRYNMSFIDAFKLANFERLQTVRQAAATQAAINNQASKQHLSSVTSPASNAVNVPDAVYRNYKTLCPWMSEDEIRKDYAKRTKKG